MSHGIVILIITVPVFVTLFELFGAMHTKRDVDGHTMVRIGCWGKWKRTELKRIKTEGV